MISELWCSVNQMEENDVKSMIRDLKSKGPDISLEDRIKLFLALTKVNYLDNAIFQMQIIYNEIKHSGLNSEFVSKHPDLKIQLMAAFDIWEDACGNIHVEEVGSCDNSCCWCCGGFGVLLCITACCGTEGLDCVFDCACSCIDPDTGWCCNCEEGGCCGSCWDSLCTAATGGVC